MTDYEWRGDPETGAVATKASDNRWGVMHPEVGGHWATDDEVQDWAPLTVPRRGK